MKIAVSAYNIHQGGGKVVLEAFLKEMTELGHEVTCYVDERLEINFNKYGSVTFFRIKPKIIKRLQAELLFKKIAKNFERIYFLGNLPPLFKLDTEVNLFLQNRLLVTKPFISTGTLKTFLRSLLEFFWFRANLRHVDFLEVQTSSMKKATISIFPSEKTRIRNYVNYFELEEFRRKFQAMGLKKIPNSFVYIASPHPHKNIKRLIIAFSKIHSEKTQYSLHINLPEKDKSFLLSQEKKVNLIRIDSSEREDILKKIYTAEYLIFPSLIESLGLPLIEAEALGTKIIASNRDFVFDVCSPSYVFDPQDIESITGILNEVLKERGKKNEI